jgi:hypothetical protein
MVGGWPEEASWEDIEIGKASGGSSEDLVCELGVALRWGHQVPPSLYLGSQFFVQSLLLTQNSQVEPHQNLG